METATDRYVNRSVLISVPALLRLISGNDHISLGSCNRLLCLILTKVLVVEYRDKRGGPI